MYNPPLQVFNAVIFSECTELCSHHPSTILDPLNIPHALLQLLPVPTGQLLILFLPLWICSFLDTSYEWHHIMCGLWCLVSLT